MNRSGPLLVFVAVAFLLVSCATTRFDMVLANAELTALTGDTNPRFTAIGTLTPSTGGKLKLLLAVSGDNFLLQVQTISGTAIFAAAGNINHHEVLNPQTGERWVQTGAMAGSIDLNGIHIPTLLLSPLVTGLPPRYSQLVKAEINNAGMRIVRAASPDMTLTYTKQLDSIIYESGAGKVTLQFGARVTDKKMSYVRSVDATFGFTGKGAILNWGRVERRTDFEPGFFLLP